MSACLLCGAHDLKPVERDVRDNRFGSPGAWTILECSACGLLQTDPRPSAAELKTLYERHYNFGGESANEGRYVRWRRWFLSSPLYRLMLAVDGDVSFHAQRGAGRLLDIGCNEGRGLEIYRANGFAPEGLELNSHAAAAARARGFVVHEDDVLAFEPTQRYRVAVLSNVLEHALDPRAMLRAVHGLLEPDGEVWISLPNAASALRRRYGRDWINWHVPFHITHFTASRLSRLLEETGFEPIRWRHITPALWLAQSAIARRFPDQPRRQREAARVLSWMALARGVGFPLLWWWNRSGRGDCIVVKARRA